MGKTRLSDLKRLFGSKQSRTFLLIAAGGLLVRLAYVLQAANTDPMFYHPGMDALFHHQWALAITRGGWLAQMPFFRAPLYPYFLAGIYKFPGTNLLVPRLVQALIGAGSCGLVYYRMGDTAKARIVWEQVIRIDPTDTLAHRRLERLLNR